MRRAVGSNLMDLLQSGGEHRNRFRRVVLIGLNELVQPRLIAGIRVAVDAQEPKLPILSITPCRDVPAATDTEGSG